MHSSNSPQFFLVFRANHKKSCVFLSLSASDMVSGKVKHRFRKPLFYPLNYGGYREIDEISRRRANYLRIILRTQQVLLFFINCFNLYDPTAFIWIIINQFRRVIQTFVDFGNFTRNWHI